MGKMDMTNNSYLKAVLREQTIAPGSDEFVALQDQREKVKGLLQKWYGSTPTINEAGSKKKGTMNKDSYDLDLTCYFPHGSIVAGQNLKEIYDNVEQTLKEEYWTQRKGSAIRLWDLEGKVDFHIDVVPGRFVDGDTGDVYLYRTSGDKERLKTNLDVHIGHIRDSGVVDAIRLMKLWRERSYIQIKTFALELLVVELLEGKADKGLDDQLLHAWQECRDYPDALTIKDPANPEGNDLVELLDDNLRKELSAVAKDTLNTIERDGWDAVFGKIEEDAGSKAAALRRMATTSPAASKPWGHA